MKKKDERDQPVSLELIQMTVAILIGCLLCVLALWYFTNGGFALLLAALFAFAFARVAYLVHRDQVGK